MDDFEIREAVAGDGDDIGRINAIAFTEIPMIKATHHEADPETVRALWTGITKKRMQDPRYRYFVAVDRETNKIAGCAGICLAGDPGPPAQKTVWPKGMNAQVGSFLFGPFTENLKKQGLKETEHCRRAGMFILPEYRKRGLAHVLSEKCNDAADAINAPTYVIAMPSAYKVFLGCGFRVLQTLDEPLREHGGPDIVVRGHIMYRPVPSA